MIEPIRLSNIHPICRKQELELYEKTVNLITHCVENHDEAIEWIQKDLGGLPCDIQTKYDTTFNGRLILDIDLSFNYEYCDNIIPAFNILVKKFKFSNTQLFYIKDDMHKTALLSDGEYIVLGNSYRNMTAYNYYSGYYIDRTKQEHLLSKIKSLGFRSTYDNDKIFILKPMYIGNCCFIELFYNDRTLASVLKFLDSSFTFYKTYFALYDKEMPLTYNQFGK